MPHVGSNVPRSIRPIVEGARSASSASSFRVTPLRARMRLTIIAASTGSPHSIAYTQLYETGEPGVVIARSPRPLGESRPVGVSAARTGNAWWRRSAGAPKITVDATSTALRYTSAISSLCQGPSEPRFRACSSASRAACTRVSGPSTAARAVA